ncbi:hypothetical protein D9756_008964 [Leucocoprinus leucothites]|uniref:Uncharacterized protein n=1 Tax=Leucocoprinus leucothites TaxID=201217 RepID=A0A8H5FUY3_9AGAR|nr:hypothetical protein D9756_008964 [Leucoagaricus leucothites]
MSFTIQDVYNNMHIQLVHTIGVSIGVLLTGGLISFGISCIFLLSGGHDPETSKQQRLLRVYIIVLLFLVTAFIIAEFLNSNAFVIFYIHSTPSQVDRSSRLLTFFVNITPILVGALTDGILVWRCYMIQKLALCYNPKIWQHIFWVFPACLWVLTIVTGCIAAPMILFRAYYERSSLLERLISGFQATALISNVVLNTYAALFIAIRLLNYRKTIMALTGRKADTSRYLHIINILLESAAINVPITIAAAVGIGFNKFFGTVIIPVAVVGQAFASVIVIHQVAVGRAFSRRQEEELSKSVAESGASGTQPKESVSSVEV